MIALALPSLICCYFDLSSVNIQLDITTQKMDANNFNNTILYCINLIGKDDPDYKGCLHDESMKVKGVHNDDEPKAQCCGRVVNYICMKKFLTLRCGVPKTQVEKNDDVHFKFWNDLNVPGYPRRCSGGIKDSIKYCHNGVEKVTKNVIIQFACTFIVLLVFGKL